MSFLFWVKLLPNEFLADTPRADRYCYPVLACTDFQNGNIRQGWANVLYFFVFISIDHPHTEQYLLLPKKPALRASPCHTHG